MNVSHEDRRGTIVRNRVSFDTADVFATAAEGRFDGGQIQRNGQLIGTINRSVVRWTPEEAQQRKAGIGTVEAKAELRERLVAFCAWLDKESYWQDERPRMLPNGQSALDGSNASRLIVGAFTEASLHNAGNSQASLAARGSGQDFAVVPLAGSAQTTFIVDYNATFTYSDARRILDSEDPNERAAVLQRYAHPNGWSEGEFLTDAVQGNRVMVMHLNHGELPSRVTCFDPKKFAAVAYVLTDDLDVAVELTTHHAPIIGGARWTDKVDSRVESRGGSEAEHGSSLPGRTVMQKGGTHYLYGHDLSWTPIPVERVARLKSAQVEKASSLIEPYSLTPEEPTGQGVSEQPGL